MKPENADTVETPDTADTGAPAAAAQPAVKFETVPLQEPLRTGNLKSVDVRKPRPFEMRGLSLQAIVQADVNAMIALLPKITNPPLLPHECENELDPADMIALAGAVAGFFYSRAEKAALMKALGQIDPETSTP